MSTWLTFLAYILTHHVQIDNLLTQLVSLALMVITLLAYTVNLLTDVVIRIAHLVTLVLRVVVTLNCSSDSLTFPGG